MIFPPSPSPLGAAILPAWFRFGDALRYASMTKHQLRPLLQDGAVVSRKVGRVWLISRDSLDEYLSERSMKAELVVRSVLG
jgi:hypothetical protein